MSASDQIVVHGRGGVVGRIEDADALREGASAQVPIRLDDGRALLVPVGLLEPRMDGSYDLPLSEDDLPAIRGDENSGAAGDARELIVIPVMRERAKVGKRRVTTGEVRIAKTVQTREEVVNLPLTREEVRVERVPVNRPVDAPVPVRHEGDTMIVPLLEEVLVVEKRLMLREELHVTRHRVTEDRQERITLRSEEATVRRTPGPRAAEHATSPASGSHDPVGSDT